jgi:hypothetical protein
LKKNDLKPMHICVLRSGINKVWNKNLEPAYIDDLTHVTNKQKDIMEVYEFNELVMKRSEKQTVKELYESGEKIIYRNDYGEHCQMTKGEPQPNVRQQQYIIENGLIFHNLDDAEFYRRIEHTLKSMEKEFDYKVYPSNYFIASNFDCVGDDNWYVYNKGSHPYTIKLDTTYYDERIANWLKDNYQKFFKYMEMKEGKYVNL